LAACDASSGGGSYLPSIKNALLALLIVLSFAAFGEELVYRGYLLIRVAELGTCSTPAYWAAMV